MWWPGLAGAAEPSRWAFLAVAIPLGLFLVRVRPTRANILLGLFLAYAAISVAWAEVWYDAANGWFELALTAGCMVIASELEDVKWLYRGLALGILPSTIIGVFQQLGYYPVVAVMPGGQALPSGLFVNPSMLGEACAPLAILMLVRRDWLYAMPVVAGLMLSQNRSGVIAFGICCAAWILFNGSRRLIAVFSVACLPILYLIATKGVDPWSSIWQRADIWDGAIKGLTWFGWGVGQFYVDFPVFSHALSAEASPTWILTAHAHNDILEFAFELGLPGIALLSCIGWQVFRQANSPERYGILAICITAMVGFPFHMPFTAALGAVMAGHAVGSGSMVRGTELSSRPVVYRWREFLGIGQAARGRQAIPI